MTTKEIQLEDIVPNPFQPRKRVDPADIEGLALTIKKQKMLQIPSGRVSPSDPTKYQLAFGHRRYAAYQWLKDHGETGYDKMPINLVEMTDEEMFCAAVVENGERKDIDPFDEAGAMQVYQKQFGKNSKEIGELFHLSDSAVRNKMRLLDLPEIYRNLISEITESSARELLRFTNFPEAFRKAPA